MSSTKKGRPVASGVIYTSLNGGAPRDFITWHDQLPYRVWLHSRRTDDGYKQLSMEIEWQGKEAKAPTEVEINLRLELAKIRSSNENSQGISATALRGITVGKLLETHSAIIDSQQRKLQTSSKRRVSLVKSFQIETYENALLSDSVGPKAPRLAEKGLASSRPENLELRATAEDSILIAYVYSEQVKTGSRQPALKAANLLGIKVSLVYVAVRTARKKGWLTSNGTNGSPVGVLTSEGNKEFTRIKGPSLYEKHVSAYVENK
ncbi:MAG: hypothetical protein RLZZ295_818 [Actinomycetota bacterium]